MTIDTERLRQIADFQDFAEHAELILAAAQALDDFELAGRYRCGLPPAHNGPCFERWAVSTSDDATYVLPPAKGADS